MITHAFFDVGGVLGSNGWDRTERARAIAHFNLDEDFEARQLELAADLETGRLSINEYLDSTVFYRPRSFGRDEFVNYMLAQSVPDLTCLALVQRVAERGRVRLFTLNNESDLLNQHRITTFGLERLFEGFLSSCWLGARKPSRLIFERALKIVQARPDQALFVDDREQNIQAARALGIRTHHFVSTEELEPVLVRHGLL